MAREIAAFLMFMAYGMIAVLSIVFTKGVDKVWFFPPAMILPMCENTRLKPLKKAFIIGNVISII